MKCNPTGSTKKKKRNPEISRNKNMQDLDDTLLNPQFKPSPPSQNNMLNLNRISYANENYLTKNQLIKPVVNRVFNKSPHHHCLKQKSTFQNIGPITPDSSFNSLKIKDGLQNSMVQNNQSNWLFNKIDTNSSPRTNYSMQPYWNNHFLSNSKKNSYSIQQSPNPLNFKQNFEKNGRLNNLFSDKKMNQKYINNFLIKPQTNNNFNIYNLINDQPGLLRKRNYLEFESINRSQNLRLNDTVKREPIIFENNENITLKISINKNCLNNCQYKRIKSDIFRLSNTITSSNPNCIKLSFDNLLNRDYFFKRIKTHAEDAENDQKTPCLTKNKNQFDLIQNIVWNSFLRNNANLKFKNQLNRVIKHVINKLKNNNKLIYHKVNIFTLINLQIPLDNTKFHFLSLSVKLRVICMLYAKYVNRKPFSQLCSNFLASIDLERESNSDKILFK